MTLLPFKIEVRDAALVEALHDLARRGPATPRDLALKEALSCALQRVVIVPEEILA